MEANISMQGMYQCADFVAGGNGYFACGGQLIPIVWSCDGEDQPFRFCTTDGQDLTLAVGNTYIAISSPAGEVTWTAPSVIACMMAFLASFLDTM